MSTETSRSTPLSVRINRSAAHLENSLLRIAALKAPSLRTPQMEPTAREALLFCLERAAWSALALASDWVIELRLGMPRKPTDAFDLLQAGDRITLEEARRLRHLAEYRNLSSRDPDAIDWAYLEGDLTEDLTAFRKWKKTAVRWLDALKSP